MKPPRITAEALPKMLNSAVGSEVNDLHDRKIIQDAAVIAKRRMEREGPDAEVAGTHAAWAFGALTLGLCDREHFCVATLDEAGLLIDAVRLHSGTTTHVSVHAREVVKEALAKEASACILYHNHPPSTADSTPSVPDMELTAKIEAALAVFGIALHDHLVVHRGDASSIRMREDIQARGHTTRKTPTHVVDASPESQHVHKGLRMVNHSAKTAKGLGISVRDDVFDVARTATFLHGKLISDSARVVYVNGTGQRLAAGDFRPDHQGISAEQLAALGALEHHASGAILVRTERPSANATADPAHKRDLALYKLAETALPVRDALAHIGVNLVDAVLLEPDGKSGVCLIQDGEMERQAQFVHNVGHGQEALRAAQEPPVSSPCLPSP